MSTVVQVAFWAAAAIDLFILIYALMLAKRMGWRGHLPKAVLFAALSAAVFGLHHIMELFLEHSAAGLAVAESVEGIAAILLGVSAYYFYRLVKGDAPAEQSPAAPVTAEPTAEQKSV